MQWHLVFFFSSDDYSKSLISIIPCPLKTHKLTSPSPVQLVFLHVSAGFEQMGIHAHNSSYFFNKKTTLTWQVNLSVQWKGLAAISSQTVMLCVLFGPVCSSVGWQQRLFGELLCPFFRSKTIGYQRTKESKIAKEFSCSKLSTSFILPLLCPNILWIVVYNRKIQKGNVLSSSYRVLKLLTKGSNWGRRFKEDYTLLLPQLFTMLTVLPCRC